MKYKISFFGASHIGRCRKENQDNFICQGQYMNAKNTGTNGIICGEAQTTELSLFGIFDGMGGEDCGEIAAYIAAKEAAEFSFSETPEKDFVSYCRTANLKICQYTQENSLNSMGTTVAMLLFGKEKIWLCNIGDSKVFLHSKGNLQQISIDHVSIAPYRGKPPLTQNLGVLESELTLSPHIAVGYYNVGDVYLICSDGLTDMIEQNEIEAILSETYDGRVVAEKLLKRALDNGGKDNISFIIIYIERKEKKFLNFLRREKNVK